MSAIIDSMNDIQQRLLDIAQAENIEDIRRVDLMKRVGCEYPSQITHHMFQLIKKGHLVRKDGRLVPSISTSQGLVRIPVLGEADCGEATKYADGRLLHTLAVSPSMLVVEGLDDVFALIARGHSMDHASVNGKRIEDGDYVIVRKADAYIPKDNAIVVSNIGGLANVKRFKRDPENGRVILLADSFRQQDFAPIIISEADDFQVEGEVVDIVKGIPSHA